MNEILNHTLYIDASKVVALDGNAIPTGAFINVQGTPFDFRKPQKLSARWDKTVDLCSQGCQGYDRSAFWLNNMRSTKAPLQLLDLQHASAVKGSHFDLERQIRYQVRSTLSFVPISLINVFSRVDISTNQPAVQVYSSFWMNLPRKVIHGGPNVNYTKWSGLAVEQQGYVDAINTPEWGVDQICKCQWPTLFLF